MPAASEDVPFSHIVHNRDHQLVSSYIQLACGCRLDFHPGDAPVRAFECEHGNSIRCVDPPTGEEIRAYEQWLREGHCPTCGRLIGSEPLPEGVSCTGCTPGFDGFDTVLSGQWNPDGMD